MAESDAGSGPPRPLVTIGLPVYNGEEYLGETLASIAAQTFDDYELIISDNASTDRTEEIGRAAAKRDPRVRYVRNAANIGGDRNYYRCFLESSGTYFLGIAHDDRLHPEYLRTVLDVFGRDPAVVFCHARTFQLDRDGQVIGTFDARPFSKSSSPHERFRDAIAPRPVVAHLGVIRTDVIRRMPPLLAYPSSDAYWQAEFALYGRLVEVPDTLFYRRIRQDSGGAIPIYERIRWSDPSRSGRVIFPNWRRPAEYLRSIGRSPLSPAEKILCAREVWRYVRRRGMHSLVRDVRVAARTVLARSRTGARIVALRDRAKKP